MVKISKEAALQYHESGRPGKIEVKPTKAYRTQTDLSLAYSPGVAYPCLEIQENPDDAYRYTDKGNLVAVISNGTAVLGLGDIGAMSGKPVMEGKGLLFKIYGGIDVFDIEVDEKDPEKFCEAVEKIAPTFGGINLEDIKAPECFYIEERLKKTLDIPVYHLCCGTEECIGGYRERHCESPYRSQWCWCCSHFLYKAVYGYWCPKGKHCYARLKGRHFR